MSTSNRYHRTRTAWPITATEHTRQEEERIVAHYDDAEERWVSYDHHLERGFLVAGRPEGLSAPRVYQSREAAAQAATVTYGLVDVTGG